MEAMPVISLSDEQKQKLQDLAQAAPQLIIHRARLILAYAAGKPTLQAASEAGISRGRARYWKRQFLARGMDIFTLEDQIPGSNAAPGEISSIAGDQPVAQSAETTVKDDTSDHKVEIPYPQPAAAVGIRHEDTLAEAGRKVWLFHFALMLFHEEGTLLGRDVEELHDMRVATRRMRTAFDVFAPAFDPKIMKHYLKGLRKIGRVLGGVRDMDVILAHAVAYQRKLDDGKKQSLEPLISAWKQVIDKKRTRLARHLKSDEYLYFKYDFNQFLQAPDPTRSSCEDTVMNVQLRDIVPVLVYGRYAAVRAYESIIPTASVAQLHALRIEFKKFRYVLEYFREILGENITQSISEIKRMQDHLGELHDVDVACQLVSDFLEKWEKEQLSRPIFERENPEPVVTYLAYLHAERYRLTSLYPELWNRFNRPEFRHNIAQAISML